MPQLKTVTIKIGERVRTMRLDLNALCGLAEEGQDIESLKVLLASGKTTLLTVRLMLWAFLITDADSAGETNFSKKSVGGWITPDNMDYAAKKLGEFITAQKTDTAEPITENPTQAE